MHLGIYPTQAICAVNIRRPLRTRLVLPLHRLLVVLLLNGPLCIALPRLLVHTCHDVHRIRVRECRERARHLRIRVVDLDARCPRARSRMAWRGDDDAAWRCRAARQGVRTRVGRSEGNRVIAPRRARQRELLALRARALQVLVRARDAVGGHDRQVERREDHQDRHPRIA